MERALDPQLISEAVGEHPGLMTPDQIGRLLADTEINLFTRQGRFDTALLDVGWYLQAVASARVDLELYSLVRQRRAHQVSAHIFDVALQALQLSVPEVLRYTFAAQVGYIGGELIPNASALARRIPAIADWSSPGTISLEAGILLLALDRRALYPLLRTRRTELATQATLVGDLSATHLAAVDGVIQGAWNLVNYLTYGRSSALERARASLRFAVASEAAEADVDSRWVAAHLLNLADGLEAASVWAVVPQDSPAAARAMTLGDPPILMLWPPQLAFLSADTNEMSPLSPTARRIVLSFPTSAGKTLLSQLFVTTHVASETTNVCIVTPTHSLGREVAAGLTARLRTLGQQLHRDGPLGSSTSAPPRTRAVVMTPERLAARLRHDPQGVLTEFGMFIIDEAHLVADRERAWILEETLSFLHHTTRQRHHRIIVLSAALGNQVHFAQWIDEQPGVISRHETWRGPRRLHVVYTARADWNAQRLEPASGRRLPRQYVPLRGEVRLRTGSDRITHREFVEPVGEMVRRRTRKGEWVADAESATGHEKLGPLIAHLLDGGPMLIVEATRMAAQRLATRVAAFLDESTETFPLVELARARVGEDHPLTAALRKGVAFHHSALPVDIQAEIEDAVRANRVRCLVATTSLTEGVNLPFKTVIVASRGYQGTDGQVEVIDAPRLLNAMGRAGRAGRETEGWLVLAELFADFSTEMFAELDREGSDLDVSSTITDEEAIRALALFEDAARASEDAVFRTHEHSVDGFLSYIWFLADALERLGNARDAAAIEAVIRDTLAWQQLDDAARVTLTRAAQLALEAFERTSDQRRRRWARAGTSLSTAALLDEIAQAILADTTWEGSGEVGIVDALGVATDSGRLSVILSLPESKWAGFKRQRNDPRGQVLEIDHDELLRDWVRGVELNDIADRHLSEVADREYRYEQLADFSASVFEHHLPWTVGLLLTWVNAGLEDAGMDVRLPDSLPGAIHYGVDTVEALELMLGGVRSRRLAARAAIDYLEVAAAEAGDDISLRHWLADLGIGGWRTRFDASPTEIADLLTFVRSPDVELVSEVLSGSTYSVACRGQGTTVSDVSVAIEPSPSDPTPAPLLVLFEGEALATIPAEHHDDVRLLLELGIPLRIRATVRDGVLEVDISLEAESDTEAGTQLPF